MLRALLYFLDQRLDIFRQSIDITNKIDFNAGFGKGVDLFVEKIAEKTHQMIDLFNRTAPVLRREGEQRQVADAEIAAAAHGLAHRLGPLLMSAQTLERSLRCPTAIPVHDDRDMFGDWLMPGIALRNNLHMSDLHDFLLLLRQLLVDFSDVAVGQFLDGVFAF